MSSSRSGILLLIVAGVLASTSCGYYNRIMSRKDLVDGSVAYRERKFAEAEALFRQAAARDPEGATTEGKTAQVFLARTLHSQFIGNRQQTNLAESAINEYKKALAQNPNDQSSYKAVASLFENLQKTDEWQRWVTERSTNPNIEPQNRAEALTALAAKQNTCANEITDTEATKKTIKGPDGKDMYQFVKPADTAELDRLRGCVTTGNELIGKAIALEPSTVKNIKSFNIKGSSDEEITKTMNLAKIFESARSYLASLTVQAMRLAEMEGRNADRDRLKAEADQYRAQYTELSQAARDMQSELDARKAAAEAEAAANAANANAAK